MDKSTMNSPTLSDAELERLLDLVLETPPEETSEHLSEADFTAYAQDTLSPEDVERTDQHLAFCEMCALRMERELTPTAGLNAVVDDTDRAQPLAGLEPRRERFPRQRFLTLVRPSPSLAAVLAALVVMAGLFLAKLPKKQDRLAILVGISDFVGVSDSPLLTRVELTLPGVGSPVERDLPSGTVHSYLVPLQAEDYLQAVLEQHGVDLVVTLNDPEGRRLLEVDSPNGTQGSETIFVVARAGGGHRLEVHSLNQGAAGRYALRIEALRPATARDRDYATAAGAYAHGEELRAKGEADSLREALASYGIALQIWRGLDDQRQQALTWRRIGQVSFALEDLPRALLGFRAAQALYRQFGDHEGEAALLNDAGSVYMSLLDMKSAESAFAQAREVYRAIGDQHGEAAALDLLADLYVSQEDLDRALDAYSQSLSSWRTLGDQPREAATLHKLGRTYSLLGRTSEALTTLQQALRLARVAPDGRNQASILLDLGWVYDLVEDPVIALQYYDQAVVLNRQEGNLLDEATALDCRGAALARLGRQTEARTSYRRALDLFQRRGQPRRAAYTLANLGWLLQADGELRRAANYQERAMQLFRETGDRHGEAHTLLGMARADYRRGNPVAARAQLEEALKILESFGGRTSNQALGTSCLAFRQDDYEISVDLLLQMGLSTRAWEVSERARLLHISRATALAPLSLREVQQQVLDPDTLLFQYALGEERSFLWVVSPDLINIYELPGRRRIEALARRTYNLLLQSQARIYQQQAGQAMRALSDVILGPAARHLENKKRLLIIADGILQHIPFAALPVTDRDGTSVPLLLDHEVVSHSSVSDLARLRRERIHRPPPLHQLAVIADPVFQSDDPRVRERSAMDPDIGVLARLPYSRWEAERILSPVKSGRLEQFRIVHFATHGLLSEKEIRNLNLRADLVVLSACPTVPGKENQDGGGVGLPQDFLHAGAGGVVASLWSVNDDSTAEFMSRFYEKMLKDRLPPSAALQAAQLSMSRDSRWQSPYYWAGFSLQGDWV